MKSDLPPMMAGDEPQDESDPVWLKDKADGLMTVGDYQGAYNAYTEALKIGINARAFANRAVADLYLGNLEQCIEDGGHAINILDKRNKRPDGMVGNPVDPEDEMVRARVEYRIGTAYLWLGAFGKAEAHMQKALETEDGLDAQETKQVQDDLKRVRAAKAALVAKDKGDTAARRARGGGAAESEILSEALERYEEAAEADPENAVVFANRSFARLRAEQLNECICDADNAMNLLKQWSVPSRGPKMPARPSRLEPPYLDDPSFVHPNDQKHEVDWLMKHGGGTKADLPSIPPEYEWVKDAAEKDDNSWIAVRRKRTKHQLDAIKNSTKELTDSLYTRNPAVIREQIKVALSLNKIGEGPSNKAMNQAEEYARKLEEHDAEMETERQREAEEQKRDIEEFNLEQTLAPVRSGTAHHAFTREHPVERTRRRLFVKVLLRKARALELLGDANSAAHELRSVLHVEPDNPEAKQRFAAVRILQGHTPPEPSEPSSLADAGAPVFGPPLRETADAVSSASTASPPMTKIEDATHEQNDLSMASTATGPKVGRNIADKCVRDAPFDDESEEVASEEADRASTNALLASAGEYMKKNDFESALQIYNYARRRSKRAWESPMVELKVLSNTSLCLTRLRGRAPELIEACEEALSRIAEIRRQGGHGIADETLVRMECACLSRRGSAYSQKGEMEKSSQDLARVREILASSENLEDEKSSTTLAR